MSLLLTQSSRILVDMVISFNRCKIYTVCGKSISLAEGVYMHLKKLKLKRSFFIFFIYEEIEDVYLFQPKVNLLSFKEEWDKDPLNPELTKFWLKMEQPFREVYNPKMKVIEVIKSNELLSLFNIYKK